MSIRIESHDDDSVTLEACGIHARISGPSWESANAAAHALGRFLTTKAELREIIRRAEYIKSVTKDVDDYLGRADEALAGLMKGLEQMETLETGVGEKP